MSGTLYIVATPIGNLEDITQRALRLLKEVSFVVAEDTRRTAKLLSYFDIHTPLMSYFEYSKKNKTEVILGLLQQGRDVALVSDAGTPTISDPGARLISQVHQQGIAVRPVPGASAILAALSISGFSTDPFHFWGFLPPSCKKREKIYRLMIELQGSHCFFESPHKIIKQAEEWLKFFSGFHFFIGREMTKKFETYYVGPFDQIIEKIRNEIPRGEYTIIVSKERL